MRRLQQMVILPVTSISRWTARTIGIKINPKYTNIGTLRILRNDMLSTQIEFVESRQSLSQSSIS